MAPTSAARRPTVPRWLVLLLVGMAGLLLEVAYTRVVSYKLWYYYTYLVIGLSLLGIGSGGIAVAIWAPIRRATTERITAVCALGGAAAIGAGYWVVARMPIDTVRIWDYGTAASLRNLAALGAICFALFAAFVALGVIVAVLLGRAGDDLGRLYFADLAGAGAGCFLAIPLVAWLSPPQVIALAATVFAFVGLLSLERLRSPAGAVAVVLLVALSASAVDEDLLPTVQPEGEKESGAGVLFSEWGPVFRVDVVEYAAGAPSRLLIHDGTWGSGIHRWDGDESTLGRYDTDSRAIPFDVLGAPPERQLIIGAAGGQEILASIHRQSGHIEAVELNPVTVSLLTDHFADYTGHLTERDDVELHQGDGRAYLARSEGDYDLVWFVAPDSYAATNAASSGAFVLSESYLYTADMVRESVEHLTDDGIVAVQFGELRFEDLPLRTGRYLNTARAAFESMGVEDFGRHVLVAAEVRDGPDLTTILLKRTAFTSDEVAAFRASLLDVPHHRPVHPPDESMSGHLVARLAAAGSSEEAEEVVAGFPKEIGAIDDDAPFFWHFTSFGDVLGEITEPIRDIDPEDSIGERVLLLLLGMAVVYAAAFLLLPFVAVHRSWRALPAKATSAVYFASLGLGFMLLEITMIQRLVRFLGYPTYSLTVTLAAILVSTGAGALLSRRWAASPVRSLVALLGALAALTAFYRFALDPITDGLQAQGLGVRVLVSLAVLVPLGLCLGAFMPLGLGLLASTARAEEYVAWAWAVNGFASVIGSVLTTILSMAFGFRAVQLAALAVYAVAVVAFVRLRRLLGGGSDDAREVVVVSEVEAVPAAGPSAVG